MLLRLWTVALVLAAFAGAVVDVKSRVDCYPEPGASQGACESRGCVWTPTGSDAPIGTPFCYYPRESGFKVQEQNIGHIQLTSGFANPYGNNYSPLDLAYSLNGKTILVTIGNSDRYVPPVGLPKGPSMSSETLNFVPGTIPGTDFFSFKVVRQSTGAVLWDTSIGGMQFADKFIQIATYLPTKNLFGFGDHVHKKLKHDLTRYTEWPMFARDIGPDSGSALSTQNLYGVHPFYLMVEGDGKTHGVLILNSNAQEVVTAPGPHLVYRTIGGRLDIAFFPGPTPEEVIQQYLQHIGRPFLPAYWALGYQLCRWGYQNLDEMKTVIQRNQAAGIPLDVPYADIDYMNHYEDFTEGGDWAGFPAYANELHQNGLHLIVIFDPAIEADYGSFQRAIDQGASFIEWDTDAQVPRQIQDQYPMAKNTKVMLGNVWPDRNTGFPDFLDTTDKTNNWWANEFSTFHQILPFDGMWIDMNEPSNFDTGTYSSVGSNLDASKLSCPISGPDATLDNPPYPTQAVFLHDGEHLSSKTLCMLGKTARRTMNFYDTKNLYGWSEARATYLALPKTTGRRGAIISRSTFISSGRYGGHWLGDNTARWEDLQTSVIGAMEFNFFGIPYVGSDICGFNGVSNEELCLRWHQMGAFHSFSRDHNTQGAPAQDPAVWPSVANAARIALNFRYYYLPYLYSLHYSASRYGHTVVRPLFFEFPHDSETLAISEQFMWGSGLMIAPALYQGMTSVHAYFPSATWYSLQPNNYGKVISAGFNDVPSPHDSLTPVFVRGGNILPRQANNQTTTDSRKNPLELLVALQPNGGASTGELYYDAGDDLLPNDNIENHARHHWTFTFTYSVGGGVLTGQCEKCANTVSVPTLDTIEVIGYPQAPNFDDFRLDGAKVLLNKSQSSWSGNRLIFTASRLINLQQRTQSSGTPKFTLSWTNM
ncbi:unnamed protein product [Caenorhabditis auriculariae]|uniref:P-type domain-containing protein n=1 Tax=Caenorhabditis auriculariae TaxID=2777116 RepID=A0A8S1HXL9_9PELO|nr:unnamed protein product [Caenorhabditis auriculariae]